MATIDDTPNTIRERCSPLTRTIIANLAREAAVEVKDKIQAARDLLFEAAQDLMGGVYENPAWFNELHAAIIKIGELNTTLVRDDGNHLVNWGAL